MIKPNATPSEQEHKALLRSILTYCSRDVSSVPHILEFLVIQFSRDFFDTQPDDYMEFTLWHLERGILAESDSALIQAQEFALIELLVSLSYEHADAFVDHLPILFVNAVVLFNSTQAHPIQSASLLLENLFHSIVIRSRKQDDTLKEAGNFKRKYFRDSKTIAKYSRDSEFIVNYVKFLSLHLKSFAADVSQIVLRWAVQAVDKQLSLESWYIFHLLNEAWDYPLLRLLALNMFEAVRARNDAKISILTKILLRVPPQVMAEQLNMTLLYQIAFFLLLSYTKEQFNAGCALIEALQSLAAQELVTQDVLNITMWNVWTGYTGKETNDVVICKLLFKGLTDAEYFEKTFDLYEYFVHAFAAFQDKNNMFAATVLMMHASLLTSGVEDQKEKLIRFFDNYDKGIATPFRECFEKHLTITQQAMTHKAFSTSQANAFIDDFAVVFGSIFGNKSGSYVMWFCYMMLRCGFKKWKTPALLLLSKLLPFVFEYNWTPREITDVGKIFRECMRDDDKVFAASADKGLEFLLTRVNLHEEKHRREVYDFINPVLGYAEGIHLVVKLVPELFIGTYPHDRELARSEMLQRYWTQLFGLTTVPEVNVKQHEAFVKMINYSFVATTAQLSSKNSMVPPSQSGIKSPESKVEQIVSQQPESVAAPSTPLVETPVLKQLPELPSTPTSAKHQQAPPSLSSPPPPVIKPPEITLPPMPQPTPVIAVPPPINIIKPPEIALPPPVVPQPELPPTPPVISPPIPVPPTPPVIVIHMPPPAAPAHQADEELKDTSLDFKRHLVELERIKREQEQRKLEDEQLRQAATNDLALQKENLRRMQEEEMKRMEDLRIKQESELKRLEEERKKLEQFRLDQEEKMKNAPQPQIIVVNTPPSIPSPPPAPIMAQSTVNTPPSMTPPPPPPPPPPPMMAPPPVNKPLFHLREARSDEIKRRMSKFQPVNLGAPPPPPPLIDNALLMDDNIRKLTTKK